MEFPKIFKIVLIDKTAHRNPRSTTNLHSMEYDKTAQSITNILHFYINHKKISHSHSTQSLFSIQDIKANHKLNKNMSVKYTMQVCKHK